MYILLNHHYAGSSIKTVQEFQRLMGLPVLAFPAFPYPAPPPHQAGGEQMALPELP